MALSDPKVEKSSAAWKTAAILATWGSTPISLHGCSGDLDPVETINSR
jgi:hypothetical protein